MYNFKFHLVTVVGIFLALALGIFIGSTFTEDGIIIQQRGTIERMREDIEGLRNERQELQAQAKSQAQTIALLEDWLGDLGELYWQANPVATEVVLIHDGSFDRGYLTSLLDSDLVQAEIVLASLEPMLAEELAQAVISGDWGNMMPGDSYTVTGNPTVPDYVLLALDPASNSEFAKSLATSLLGAELPVIALGNSGWEGLADMVSHRLYNSVSHLDTPLGQYCLGAILRGQGGHYGLDNLLPPREEGQ